MIARVEGKQTTQFEYDYDNRLVKIAYPDGSVIKFGYDGLGRRVWRQDSMGTRYFYYDGDRVIAEREGNTWVVRYLMGISPVGFVSGGTLKVYHADRLGSVRWVTDGGQNILVSYVYEGFGKIVGQNGGGGGSYQWCGLWGYRNDWDAGLIHIGARYYEVETGRWVQKDPILGNTYKPQTLNLYVYCINNSLNFIDPLGSDPRVFFVLILAAIIIIIGSAGLGGGGKPSMPDTPTCGSGFPKGEPGKPAVGCPDPHCPNEYPGCCAPAEQRQQQQGGQGQQQSFVIPHHSSISIAVA